MWYRYHTVNYIKNRTLHNIKGETFFAAALLYPYTQKDIHTTCFFFSSKKKKEKKECD